MKKFLLLVIASFFLGMMIPSQARTTESVHELCINSASLRTVTVYIYKVYDHSNGTRMTVSNGKTTGVYNSDTDMINIGGKDYEVMRNPYYGGDGKAANYPYYAGGIYFFYL